MSAELIATQAITLLSPYLMKGLDEISKSAAKDLWEKVKSVFTSKKKDEIIEKFATLPSDLKTAGQVEYILQEELSNSFSLFEEVSKLVEILQKDTSYNSEIKQVGDNNIAVGGQINNSNISIHK